MKFLSLLWAILVMGLLTGSAEAGWDWLAFFGHKHKENPCKTCRTYCNVEEGEETCWEVEQEEICVPPIHFPWSKPCDRKEGWVRKVKVLKEKEYPVQKVEYESRIESRFGGTGCRPVSPQEMEPKPMVPPSPAQ